MKKVLRIIGHDGTILFVPIHQIRKIVPPTDTNQDYPGKSIGFPPEAHSQIWWDGDMSCVSNMTFDELLQAIEAALP